MEQYKRDFFIARIQAGYIPVIVNKTRLLIHHPNLDVSLLAQEEYIQAYETAEDLMTGDDLLQYLIDCGLWSHKKEKEFTETLPKHIEQLKIELYKSLLKSNTRQQLREYLDIAKKHYDELSNLRHYYDYITKDGYANYVKTMFIIENCTTLNGNRVDWSEHDLLRVMQAYQKNMLSADDIRILARTYPWNALWGVLKQNGKVFEGPLTAEQQSLISWSTMYDKIYESPDCPPDDIINDDDMLDGWLLLQKQKREAEQKKNEVEQSLSSKVNNEDEIFIPVETAADAQKIDLLNPQHATVVKKQRLKQVKQKGKILEQDLIDVKQKVIMQAQQEYAQRVKGK